MNRKEFLKRFGVGLGAIAASPTLISSLSVESDKSPRKPQEKIKERKQEAVCGDIIQNQEGVKYLVTDRYTAIPLDSKDGDMVALESMNYAIIERRFREG